jgi:hypothetical protein
MEWFGLSLSDGRDVTSISRRKDGSIRPLRGLVEADGKTRLTLSKSPSRF